MRINFFSKADDEPGEWRKFGDSDIEVKLRRMRTDVYKRINKAHGKEIMVKGKDGTTSPEIIRTLDESEAWAREMARHAITDVRNVKLSPQAESDCEYLARLFSRKGQDALVIEVGSEFDLEGRLLSADTKNFVFDLGLIAKVWEDVEENGITRREQVNQGLVIFCLNQALQMQAEFARVSGEAEKN